jgi:hypothetical protein
MPQQELLHRQSQAQAQEQLQPQLNQPHVHGSPVWILVAAIMLLTGIVIGGQSGPTLVTLPPALHPAADLRVAHDQQLPAPAPTPVHPQVNNYVQSPKAPAASVIPAGANADHNAVGASAPLQDRDSAACGELVDFVTAMQYCLGQHARMCSLAEVLDGVNIVQMQQPSGSRCRQSGDASMTAMGWWSHDSTRMWTTTIGDCQPGSVRTVAASDAASQRDSLTGKCTPIVSAAAAVKCCADRR